jgi:hypothetical protein
MSDSRNQDFSDLTNIEDQLVILNSAIPANYDELVGTRDGSNKLTKVEFKLNTVLVTTVNLTYNGGGFWIGTTITKP